ncbi:A disintegrin and metalloproteinase with thrombospondin motifs like isoform X3 [Eurosta solidaginis]|uniref:A disintegrin and metalloproteinase with thrombospondin motifs like isoform X3 n=1 Tax=Eurosta solidaginis TaxID=178769 RepID=UPI003530C157
MSHKFAILLTLTSIVTTCTSLPDYHKQMSPTQLQSVFHVDSVNAVPHYEVVQLLHHSFDDGVATAPQPEHYRSRWRRSINSISTLDTDTRPTLKQPHHVKKDLSKNSYYSELKAAANAPGAGGVNSLQQAGHGKFIGDLNALNEHNVTFKAFGENLNLALKRTESLFKGGSAHTLRMWTVRGEPNATHGLDMQEVLDEDAQSSDQIGEIYQDEANMAAILMRRHLETGDLIMEGSIGHEMVIKPLPHELSPNPDAAHHVVYKREAQPLEHLSDFAFMEPDDLATSDKLERLQQRRQRRSTPLDDDEAALEDLDEELENVSAKTSRTRNKRQVPYTIYPEVLVIIDYDGYRLHGGDNLQVKRYFVSFWNGVDLRYRLLKGPRIRISIAGIIISRGRDATPYLERNRVGRDAIDSAAALTDMGKYLFRERRLPVYDIAVAITKLDMCRRTTAYGECNRGTAGFAYVGGACVVNKRLEKVNSVAIIEDTGGFSGIIVAAHEVGHLLGAVHDGSPPPSYLGGPGAQRCRWEDGYIMSDLRHTERGFRWSPCTVQSFHHFLNGDTATCLHNAPHEDSALGRAMPGTLLSLDAQCRRDRGTYACFKDERVCAQLFCFDAQTGYCVAYRPAAEGSTCGNGMQCLDGRCTPLPSNVIPTYRSGNENIVKKIEHNNEKDDDEEENDEEEDDDDEENKTKEEHQDIDDSAYSKHSKTKTINKINTYSSRKQTDTHTHNNNSKQRQVEYSTFEFLARFLAQNPQWQQLLGQAVLQANALTSAAATNDPNVAAKQKAVQPQQIEQNKLSQGMVVVKRNVSSSTSSSSGDSSKQDVGKNSEFSSVDSSVEENEQIEKDIENDEFENETTVDRKDNQKNSEVKKVNIGNKEIENFEKVTEPQQKLILTQNQPAIKTQIPTLTKFTQIQQQKQFTQSTAQPPHQPTQQANLFQYYTHELRKQLQYYLGLLRVHTTPDSVSASDSSSTRSSISSSDGSRESSNSGIRRGIATDMQNSTIQTNNLNYSNIVSVAAKLQKQQQTAQLQEEQNDDNDSDSDNDHDNEDDINVDVDADVDDASNEAIDDKQQKLVNWKAFPF